MNKKNIIISACCLFVVLSSALASDYHSPRTAALGGAGRAGPLLNDSIILNPSFTSFLPTYAIGGSYGIINGPPAPGYSQLKGRNWHVSVQDGRSELFQAGAAYTQREEGGFLHLGASKSVVQRLGFGLSGKFFFGSQGRKTGKDMTFSMTFIGGDIFQAAFVIDNIIQSKEMMAIGLRREYILGIKINIQGIVLLYLDPHLTQTLSIHEGFGQEIGGEFIVMKDFFIRAGMLRNATIPWLGQRGRAYGFGLGWVAPRISLDAGIARAIEPRAATAYVFGATVYF
ncbi:MAG: hypothetical protein A2583_16505 [Bdellovibrionales bacterium RIFOXYD1_FULL_53_11]|nr:MAG: hypothetical protein A2583_16505 [Bdellovibrionales bacterium RIFOXYD1_FULL_53_11]